MTSCHDDDVCCTKNEQCAPVRRRIDLRETKTVKKEERELIRALDTKGTPKLKLSFDYMPSTLCNFFTTRKGEQMWPRIHAILKFYCEEPNDFLMVEDFSGIYCYHWGETLVYKSIFGVHQNDFFANLQEYVDTWFDQICAMRMRLRANPRTENQMKLNYRLQTRYDKEKDGKSVFAFRVDYCGQDIVEKTGSEIRLPALNPEDFPELDTETLGKMKLARRSLYFMLFYHFGRDGIILKQYDQATKKFGWGGYEVTNEKTIRKYMADIIEFKEKGFVKRIRPRFDVPRLSIDTPVLIELGLLEEYKQAKKAFLAAKTQPVSTSTSTTIAQQPQHSTATVNVPLRGRARSVRGRGGRWTNEAIHGMIQSLPAYGSFEYIQPITDQEVTQTTTTESSSELEGDSEVEILRNELQKMSPTVRRFVLILANEPECKILDSQLLIRPEFRDKNDQSELLALALDNRYGDIIGTTMVPVNDIQFELKVKSDQIIQVIQSTNFY